MAEARPRAPRVLLVDDDAENLVLLSEVLTSEGLDVVGTARDGEAGIRLALELRPDVALIDLLMPAMDGLGATREIRQAELPTEVVILTFYGELLTAPAHEVGAFAYLVKGCSVALMRDVIMQAWHRGVERRRQTRGGSGSTTRPRGAFMV